VIFAGIDGRLGGLLAIADPVKATTAEALVALRYSIIDELSVAG
jgi:Cu+-exporting ATPase